MNAPVSNANTIIPISDPLLPSPYMIPPDWLWGKVCYSCQRRNGSCLHYFSSSLVVLLWDCNAARRPNDRKDTGRNSCSVIHWVASNPVGGKYAPSFIPAAGEDRLNATWHISGVTPKGHESPGSTPVNTGAPLSVLALDTICQVNLKTLLKVGPDRVLRKELVWVTPVCFCGRRPSYFCCPWIFLIVFLLWVFFSPPFNNFFNFLF